MAKAQKTDEPNCLSRRYLVVVTNEGPKNKFSVLKLSKDDE